MFLKPWKVHNAPSQKKNTHTQNNISTLRSAAAKCLLSFYNLPLYLEKKTNNECTYRTGAPLLMHYANRSAFPAPFSLHLARFLYQAKQRNGLLLCKLDLLISVSNLFNFVRKKWKKTTATHKQRIMLQSLCNWIKIIKGNPAIFKSVHL
jgi:hypothetical protein